MEIWNALLASSAGLAIDRWAGSALDTARTSYDAAMDAAYNSLHEGGGWHRLFDGGHDLAGAWKAVRDAHPDDRFIDEFQGYVSGLWNDVITPNGLPLVTLNKETFDGILEALRSAGIDPDYVRDAVSFTGTELLGGIAGIVVILLAVRKKDDAIYWQIAGSLGVSAIAAANPVALAVALYAACRGWQNMPLAPALPLKRDLAGAGAKLMTGGVRAGGAVLGAIGGGAVAGVPGAVAGTVAGAAGGHFLAGKIARAGFRRSEEQDALIALAMLGTMMTAQPALPLSRNT